ESTPENSEAFKAGYKTICDIGQERIKRAARKIRDDFPLTTSELDTGFRAFKVDSSNIKDVYLYPDQFKQETLELLADNIKPDRTPDDLLINSMLRLGVPLSAAITKKFVFGKKIYLVEHDDSPVYITACFDENLNEDVITEIAKLKPIYAIFRDNGIISDSLMTNFDQIFNTYSHDTIRRVI
ncbi:MAG: type III restriction endonuclease subunit M, partial [Synergistaceae bacterium]|nr:type III restriction endonuclease subunit M [Synergistaceae bacterium]